jgi:hypothetical protein
MEVGKLIVNAVKSKAHITVSVKPFGCMPSSGVSDGVQSLITNRFPGTIFCAVETSGDGATNFYSRVQMYMFKARLAAQEELRKTFEELGVTEEQIRTFLAENPSYASPLHHAPHHGASSAANLVREVAPLLGKSKLEQRLYGAKQLAGKVAGVAKTVPGKLSAAAAWLQDADNQARLRQDGELVLDLLKGRAKDRFAPLVSKLAGKAFFENNPEVAHVVAEDRIDLGIAAEE